MQILEYTLLQSETVGFASQNSLFYHAKQCLLQDTDKEAITQNNTLLKIFTAHSLPNNLCHRVCKSTWRNTFQKDRISQKATSVCCLYQKKHSTSFFLQLFFCIFVLVKHYRLWKNLSTTCGNINYSRWHNSLLPMDNW